MRSKINVNKYTVLNTELCQKIWKEWFVHWTTPYAISQRIYESESTKGGYVSRYTKAFQKSSYLDARFDLYPKKYSKKDEWVKSSKRCKSYRLNLQPYFEYMESEKSTIFSEFDKYILKLLFSSNIIRQKTVESSKNYFQAITNMILEHLRMTLGEVAREIFWIDPDARNDPKSVQKYLRDLAIKRSRMNFEEFKKLELRVRQNETSLIPGYDNSNNYMVAWQLMTVVPEDFIEKIIFANIPKQLHEIWRTRQEEYTKGFLAWDLESNDRFKVVENPEKVHDISEYVADFRSNED